MIATAELGKQEVVAGRLLETATRQLSTCPSTTPRLDADVLLAHTLGLSRTKLLISRDKVVDTHHRDAFQALVQARTRGVPIAYLTGHREFMGFAFRVGPGVLVPRSDTECLVEWACDHLSSNPRLTDPVILDVGTGAGAIGLSIAKLAESALVTLSDISAEALSYASINSTALGLTDSVGTVRGDLLQWFAGRADLVVANLPYLRPSQCNENWDIAAEPSAALLGGSEGLDLVRRLIADAPRVLKPQGVMALEIDPFQIGAVEHAAREALPACRIDRLADLTGATRFAVIRNGIM